MLKLKSRVNVHLKMILKSFYQNLVAIPYYFTNIHKWKKYYLEHKIIYCLTPEHKNIGDMAIVCGTYSYFNKVFSDLLVLEFSTDEVRKYKYIIKKITNKDDIVFLHGGGNLGDWYLDEEILRQDLVKLLHRKRIISLPQTVSFGNTKKSEWVKKRAAKIYLNHKKFALICRDEKSHNFIKNFLPGIRSLQLPDMALNIPIQNFRDTREGILLCLRNDIEKNRTKDFDDMLYSICLNKEKNVMFTDTMANKPIKKEERLSVVTEKIVLFSKSKIVITDRYHGVIFAYLSNTPCIAISSADHKVSENCKYFEATGFIKWANNLREVETILSSGFEDNQKYHIDFYETYFKQIESLIENY